MLDYNTPVVGSAFMTIVNNILSHLLEVGTFIMLIIVVYESYSKIEGLSE